MASGINRLICIFTTTLIIISCERVQFDPKIETLNDKLPVVYGVLGNHPDYRQIELTRTAPYMDGTEYPVIENAIVTVSDENNTYTFNHIRDGIYQAPEDFQPGIDTTYNLSISIEGEIYEAQSLMPPSVNIHSVKVQPDRWEDEDAGIYEITAWIKDNERENERFIAKYAINEVPYDSVSVWSQYTDQLTNNIWLEDAVIFGNIEANPGDTIDVYVLSVSGQYYDFVQAAEKNRVGYNPFTPPAGVTITGNISNGALGFFQVSAIVQETVVVPDDK
ncbi:DUF4249 family protein [Anaerophaga thermohalophila]|jgi:hypothetical protein|uniref:DUF4249 family protein n=1 Tax=Anaerophaga thermohalophila TaxID=177400 RepID=UPI0009E1C289|nr:DUF4249 family protein [Anaerophaga thermohalophila]